METSVSSKKIARWTIFAIAIIVIAATFGLLLFSFIQTLSQYSSLHNSGVEVRQIWITISHHWWSLVSVKNTTTQAEQSIFLNLSPFGIAMIVLFIVGILTMIISSIVFRNNGE